VKARLAAVLALTAALTGTCLSACSAPQAGRGSPASTTRPAPSSSTASTASSASAAPSTSAAANGCPATYAAPDPKRPAVALSFTVAADLHTVTGTEHITFTPDLPITELVFRLTANTAPTVAAGNKVQVTAATADHGAGTPTYTLAGASPLTQGGLLHLPFAAPVAAGTTITADLAFTVTLGAESFDRLGRSNGYAWFASAHPLLAWERGVGWHSEPMLQFTAESATSEAMKTDLTVTAPGTDTVIMSGDPIVGAPDAQGRKVWHATLDTARDVSVSVGPFVVTDTVVAGVQLRVGAATALVRDQLVPQFQRAITELSARLGPFPFPSLSVARLPGQGGGIEYPGAILMLDSSVLVSVHETAHQWFYAMVGDSQALHAWLDEAFASWAEQLVDNDPPPVADLTAPGQVDRPTASYGLDEDGYYFVTYDKGAAAIHAARAAAGPVAFDAAIKCYIAANAWRIANPPDLLAALSGLPAAVTVLKQAQALP
jgi:hypothetical protein